MSTAPVATPSPGTPALPRLAPAIRTSRTRRKPDKLPPPNHKQGVDAVREIIERESYLRRVLEPRFREIVEYWRLYLGHKSTDARARDENWRANIRLPWPYLMVEVITAVISDLLNSGDPLVQATNVMDRDRGAAEAIEKHLSYQLRQNAWRLVTDNLHRATAVQGTTFAKIVHTRRVQPIRVHNTPADHEAFQTAVKDAEQAVGVGAPDHITNRVAFDRWRELVNGTSKGVRVPPVPEDGLQPMVLFDGPEIQPVSIFETRFDPYGAGNIQQQEIFIHRYTKPRSFTERMVRSGKWNKSAVEEAGMPGGDKFSTWEKEVAQMAGFPSPDLSNPQQDFDEYWECFLPHSKMKHPIILNRKAVVNLDPWEMPFWHGYTPYFALRNVTAPRPAPPFMGMSEYQQTKDMFKEADTLRSLRLDAVLLAVIPILLKRTTAGDIPDAVANLRPGQILNVSAIDQVTQLVKSDPGLLAGFREMPEIKAEIEEVSGATPNVRGAAATVGRVSATESERRVAQALIRQKTKLMRFEEDYRPGLHQILMLMYQFSPPKRLVEIGGDNPTVAYDRPALLGALQQGFEFRGASRTVDKAIVAQQSMQFATTFAQFMLPQETRALMRVIYENFGLEQVDKVISSDGDKLVQVPVPQGVAGLGAAQGAAGVIQGAPGAPGAAGTPGQQSPAAQTGILGPDGQPIQQ